MRGYKVTVREVTDVFGSKDFQFTVTESGVPLSRTQEQEFWREIQLFAPRFTLPVRNGDSEGLHRLLSLAAYQDFQDRTRPVFTSSRPQVSISSCDEKSRFVAIQDVEQKHSDSSVFEYICEGTRDLFERVRIPFFKSEQHEILAGYEYIAQDGESSRWYSTPKAYAADIKRAGILQRRYKIFNLLEKTKDVVGIAGDIWEPFCDYQEVSRNRRASGMRADSWSKNLVRSVIEGTIPTFLEFTVSAEVLASLEAGATLAASEVTLPLVGGYALYHGAKYLFRQDRIALSAVSRDALERSSRSLPQIQVAVEWKPAIEAERITEIKLPDTHARAPEIGLSPATALVKRAEPSSRMLDIMDHADSHVPWLQMRLSEPLQLPDVASKRKLQQLFGSIGRTGVTSYQLRFTKADYEFLVTCPSRVPKEMLPDLEARRVGSIIPHESRHGFISYDGKHWQGMLKVPPAIAAATAIGQWMIGDRFSSWDIQLQNRFIDLKAAVNGEQPLWSRVRGENRGEYIVDHILTPLRKISQECVKINPNFQSTYYDICFLLNNDSYYFGTPEFAQFVAELPSHFKSCAEIFLPQTAKLRELRVMQLLKEYNPSEKIAGQFIVDRLHAIAPDYAETHLLAARHNLAQMEKLLSSVITGKKISGVNGHELLVHFDRELKQTQKILAALPQGTEESLAYVTQCRDNIQTLQLAKLRLLTVKGDCKTRAVNLPKLIKALDQKYGQASEETLRYKVDIGRQIKDASFTIRSLEELCRSQYVKLTDQAQLLQAYVQQKDMDKVVKHLSSLTSKYKVGEMAGLLSLCAQSNQEIVKKYLSSDSAVWQSQAAAFLYYQEHSQAGKIDEVATKLVQTLQDRSVVAGSLTSEDREIIKAAGSYLAKKLDDELSHQFSAPHVEQHWAALEKQVSTLKEYGEVLRSFGGADDLGKQVSSRGSDYLLCIYQQQLLQQKDRFVKIDSLPELQQLQSELSLLLRRMRKEAEVIVNLNPEMRPQLQAFLNVDENFVLGDLYQQRLDICLQQLAMQQDHFIRAKSSMELLQLQDEVSLLLRRIHKEAEAIASFNPERRQKLQALLDVDENFVLGNLYLQRLDITQAQEYFTRAGDHSVEAQQGLRCIATYYRTQNGILAANVTTYLGGYLLDYYAGLELARPGSTYLSAKGARFLRQGVEVLRAVESPLSALFSTANVLRLSDHNRSKSLLRYIGLALRYEQSDILRKITSGTFEEHLELFSTTANLLSQITQLVVSEQALRESLTANVAVVGSRFYTQIFFPGYSMYSLYSLYKGAPAIACDSQYFLANWLQSIYGKTKTLATTTNFIARGSNVASFFCGMLSNYDYSQRANGRWCWEDKRALFARGSTSALGFGSGLTGLVVMGGGSASLALGIGAIPAGIGIAYSAYYHYYYEDSDALLHNAECFLRQGDTGAALDRIHKCLHEDPNNRQAQLLLLSTRLNKGQFAEILRTGDDSWLSDVRFGNRFRIYRAEAQLGLGKVAEAQAEFTRVLQDEDEELVKHAHSRLLQIEAEKGDTGSTVLHAASIANIMDQQINKVSEAEGRFKKHTVIYGYWSPYWAKAIDCPYLGGFLGALGINRSCFPTYFRDSEIVASKDQLVAARNEAEKQLDVAVQIDSIARRNEMLQLRTIATEESVHELKKEEALSVTMRQEQLTRSGLLMGNLVEGMCQGVQQARMFSRVAGVDSLATHRIDFFSRKQCPDISSDRFSERNSVFRQRGFFVDSRSAANKSISSGEKVWVKDFI